MSGLDIFLAAVMVSSGLASCALSLMRISTTLTGIREELKKANQSAQKQVESSATDNPAR